MTTIKVRKNGPYLVTGSCELTDHEGKRFEVTENFVPCRCGGSHTKPFCDRTHKHNGFRDPQ